MKMPKIIDTYHGVISAPTLESLKRILESAAKKSRTYMSSIQQFDEANKVLNLVRYLKFSDAFGERFRQVRPFDGCSCGRAIAIRNPGFINDVRKDQAYKPYLELVEAEGYRAVLSVPVIDNRNKRLGVISTHFAEPKMSFDLNSLDEFVEELVPILSSMPIPDLTI